MKASTSIQSCKRLAIALAALILVAPAASALNFGLLLDQNFAVANSGFGYEPALVPHFSALLGDSGDLFLSGSLRAVYGIREDEEDLSWSFVPELLRSEFIWRFRATDLQVGRMNYSDPMGIVAGGLFDGARLSFHTAAGTFGIGVWYTGLQYTNRARIGMTAGDLANSGYFASRRVMAAADWDHPSVAPRQLPGLRLNLALLGQVDVNNGDRNEHYHSQYLVARAMMPVRRLVFELGSSVGAGQLLRGGGADFQLGLAADAAMHWLPRSPVPSMVSLAGRYTSGWSDGPITAFTPVTQFSHGHALRSASPGISTASLTYAVRLHRSLVTSLRASGLIRSGTILIDADRLGGDPNDRRFLGTELFVSLAWSPLSDLALSLGAGMFQPRGSSTLLGRLDLGLVLSLF